MSSETGPESRLYFRQLLSGRDFATNQLLAQQMVNYAYAIGDRATGEAIVVDPAYAPEELLQIIENDDMTPVGAFVTHYHQDHAGGLLGTETIAGIAALLEVADVPVYLQKSEMSWVTRSTGVSPAELSPTDPGEVVMVGEIEITCLHTPGHTPGSQCLLVDGHLVTGDTLFLYGCGRTDLPGGDADELYETLLHRLAALPDETSVFAGHAYDPAPTASFGSLRQLNPVLAPLSRDLWTARFS